jgi:hypothetical protein
MVSGAAEPWLALVACLGVLFLVLAVAGAFLAPGENPWMAMLGLGVSALLLAATSYGLLLQLDALRLTARRCLVCGGELTPYAFGGWFFGVIALLFACVGCAVGVQAARHAHRWLLTVLLAVGLLLPPLVVCSFVTDLSQPTIPSERFLALMVAIQAALLTGVDSLCA